MGKEIKNNKPWTGISSQSSTQAIRAAERADLDGTRLGTKPRLNTKAAGNGMNLGVNSRPITRASARAGTRHSTVQHWMQQTRLEESPSQVEKVETAPEVEATCQGTSASTSGNEEKYKEQQPGTSQGKPEETRQVPNPSVSHREMISPELFTKRRGLSFGLSGSRVKRYWKLVNEGVPCEEARRKASEGYIRKPDLNNATAPPVIIPKAAVAVEKTAAEPSPSTKTEIRVSYAKTVSSVKMAVFAKETPFLILSNEQLTWISEALLDAVLLEETVKVKFEAVRFKTGTLAIDCTDAATASWLERTVPTLRGWHGPELSVSTADKAPRGTVVNVVFPRMGRRTMDEIFQMVDHQNHGLRTEAWKIISQAEDDEAKRVVAIIDDQSLKAIAGQGNTLSFRFGRVPVKLTGKRC